MGDGNTGRGGRTPDERREAVRRLVAAGLSNGEIAEALGERLDIVKWDVSELRAAQGEVEREAIAAAEVERDLGGTRRASTAVVGAALLALIGAVWLLVSGGPGAGPQADARVSAARPAARMPATGLSNLVPPLPTPPPSPRVAPGASTSTSAALSFGVSPGRLPEGFVYAVREGDTVEAVAQRFGVDAEAIGATTAGVASDAAGLPAGTVLPVPAGADALQFLRYGWTRAPDGPAEKPPALQWPLSGEVEGVVQSAEATGIDIRVPEGTPVRAAAGGTVVSAGRDECCAYGLVAIVEHDGGYATVYAHLSWVRVAEGQRVERGEVLGGSGTTSGNEGPRLHFGLLRGDAVRANASTVRE